LHQFNENQPDLNYNNKAVIERMTKVLEYWLGVGVAGFNLDKVRD